MEMLRCTMSETWSYGSTRECQSVPNVNIHETENIQLTQQENRKRQPVKKND